MLRRSDDKKYFQGQFKPINTQKYVGNVKTIFYRSGWEFRYMMQLDSDPNVIQWANEELAIPYYSPLDKKRHRYFPDFIVKRKVGDGVKIFMIEIKPLRHAKFNAKTKNRKTRLNEGMTVAVNQAKWAAAKAYCERKGMIFQVLTEKELGYK